MKSMTIHGVDQQLANLIKAKAQAEGMSVNKTIKLILETATSDTRAVDQEDWR